MKQRITINHCHASSVRPDLSACLFTLILRGRVIISFSPPRTDFAARVTLSDKRGAERNRARGVRIVVVIIAAGIDIIEIISIVSRPEPPPRGRGRTNPSKFSDHNPCINHGKSLYRSRSFFITALTSLISFSTMSIQ